MIKDTTNFVKSASCLDLHFEIAGKEKLLITLYGKHDDFSFRIINFPFICGNIPSASAYGVVFSYHNSYVMPELDAAYLYRARLLTIRLLEQDNVATRLKSSQQESELLINFCYFVCIILVILCSLLCCCYRSR